MKITESKIEGSYVIEPLIHQDDRGFLLETFQEERYTNLLNIDLPFVQDNIARSFKNILRGMHFQKEYPQGKLVHAIQGEVFDVIVDLRRDSPSYGLWDSEILSVDNRKQFWIPPGLAHGFFVLSKYADLSYKFTEYYFPEHERCLIWNDPQIGIDWPTKDPIISSKDKNGHFFKDL